MNGFETAAQGEGAVPMLGSRVGAGTLDEPRMTKAVKLRVEKRQKEAEQHRAEQLARQHRAIQILNSSTSRSEIHQERQGFDKQRIAAALVQVDAKRSSSTSRAAAPHSLLSASQQQQSTESADASLQSPPPPNDPKLPVSAEAMQREFTMYKRTIEGALQRLRADLEVTIEERDSLVVLVKQVKAQSSNIKWRAEKHDLLAAHEKALCSLGDDLRAEKEARSLLVRENTSLKKAIHTLREEHETLKRNTEGLSIQHEGSSRELEQLRSEKDMFARRYAQVQGFLEENARRERRRVERKSKAGLSASKTRSQGDGNTGNYEERDDDFSSGSDGGGPLPQMVGGIPLTSEHSFFYAFDGMDGQYAGGGRAANTSASFIGANSTALLEHLVPKPSRNTMSQTQVTAVDGFRSSTLCVEGLTGTSVGTQTIPRTGQAYHLSPPPSPAAAGGSGAPLSSSRKPSGAGVPLRGLSPVADDDPLGSNRFVADGSSAAVSPHRRISVDFATGTALSPQYQHRTSNVRRSSLSHSITGIGAFSNSHDLDHPLLESSKSGPTQVFDASSSNNLDAFSGAVRAASSPHPPHQNDFLRTQSQIIEHAVAYESLREELASAQQEIQNRSDSERKLSQANTELSQKVSRLGDALDGRKKDTGRLEQLLKAEKIRNHEMARSLEVLGAMINRAWIAMQGSHDLQGDKNLIGDDEPEDSLKVLEMRLEVVLMEGGGPATDRHKHLRANQDSQATQEIVIRSLREEIENLQHAVQVADDTTDTLKSVLEESERRIEDLEERLRQTGCAKDNSVVRFPPREGLLDAIPSPPPNRQLSQRHTLAFEDGLGSMVVSRSRGVSGISGITVQSGSTTTTGTAGGSGGELRKNPSFNRSTRTASTSAEGDERHAPGASPSTGHTTALQELAAVFSDDDFINPQQAPSSSEKKQKRDKEKKSKKSRDADDEDHILLRASFTTADTAVTSASGFLDRREKKSKSSKKRKGESSDDENHQHIEKSKKSKKSKKPSKGSVGAGDEEEDEEFDKWVGGD